VAAREPQRPSFCHIPADKRCDLGHLLTTCRVADVSVSLRFRTSKRGAEHSKVDERSLIVLGDLDPALSKLKGSNAHDVGAPDRFAFLGRS
jgi:hypothetical protein